MDNRYCSMKTDLSKGYRQLDLERSPSLGKKGKDKDILGSREETR